MTQKIYNVLILCTGNSARSIMAEAVFNTIGASRFKAYSAGSHPTGTANPFAIEQAQLLKYPIENLHSKSWDEFSSTHAIHMDFIITVCDKAAGEICPTWPGKPITAHWGLEDPVIEQGTDEEKRKIFQKTCQYIMNRVRLLLVLPLDSLDSMAIKRELDAIGLVSKSD